MRKLIFLIIIFFAVTNFAQFRRISLLEEATNASCSPCAAANPELQKFISTNFGGVISVRYHASWPGYDPMYEHNTTENSNRISYYGISGVPGYAMNGVSKGVPGSAVSLQNEMLIDNENGSPIWITVSGALNSTNYDVNVQIISTSAISSNNLKLRVAIIERRIEYATAPGSNGEKEFNDVFRKMLPSTNGEVIQLDENDTLDFSFSAEISRDWNLDDIAVIAWIQDDNTKQVFQSNINLPTFIINTDGTNAEILTENQTVTQSFQIINNNLDSLNIRILPEIELAEGWDFSLLADGINTDSIKTILQPGDTLLFNTELTTNENPGNGTINLIAQNLDDEYLYSYSAYYFGILPKGNILLIDADGGENYETYFKTALDSSNVEFTNLDRAFLSTLSTQLSEYDFDAVFWNSGWGFPAITQSDLDFLTPYLDNGGNLFISGQDIGWDIFDASGSSNFVNAQNFYKNYLGSTYVNDNSGVYSMIGIAGDPISDGLSFSIRSLYSRYPEEIRVYGSNSTGFIKYTNTSKYGGIRNETENYKTIYLGIGLELVSTTQAQINLIKKSLVWFDVLDGIPIEEEPLVPTKFYVSQNYPNPFFLKNEKNSNISSGTNVDYFLPSNGLVILKIYDVTGKEITTLMNNNQDFGYHTFHFSESSLNLAAGVYFYQLRFNNFVESKKMILIK